MISRYYLDKLTVTDTELEALQSLIKSVNKKDEIAEIEDIIDLMMDSLQEPFNEEFDPQEYHQWLVNNVSNDEEAREEMYLLSYEDAIKYDEYVENNIE